VLPLRADAPLQEAMHEASDCRRCHLHELASQTVFGEGPAHARSIFVGEQPGDQEDVIGRPFVGPAGQIMDRAMEEAGIDRRTVYITNAVKHFKFEPRGKRRIHKTPETPEIQACRFWLDVELVRLRPKLVVAMGGTAARAVLGRPSPSAASAADLSNRTTTRCSSPCIRHTCCVCRTKMRRRGSTAPSSQTCARSPS